MLCNNIFDKFLIILAFLLFRQMLNMNIFFLFM